MALTRLALEADLVRLVGRLMDLVGNYGEDASGYQGYLNAPIRDGLREMGYPVADPLTVADADLAGLDNFAVRRLIEWSELYVLDQVSRDWWRVIQAPPKWLTPEVAVAMESRINRRIGELREVVLKPFTPFVRPLAVARLTAGHCATPVGIADVVPPGVLAAHWYGLEPSAYWGWGDCP